LYFARFCASVNARAKPRLVPASEYIVSPRLTLKSFFSRVIAL
jgi:hypothetical protein